MKYVLSLLQTNPSTSTLDSVLWKEPVAVCAPGKPGAVWPFPKWVFRGCIPGKGAGLCPRCCRGCCGCKQGFLEHVSLECLHKGAGDTVVSPSALQGCRGALLSRALQDLGGSSTSLVPSCSPLFIPGRFIRNSAEIWALFKQLSVENQVVMRKLIKTHK